MPLYVENRQQWERSLRMTESSKLKSEMATSKAAGAVHLAKHAHAQAATALKEAMSSSSDSESPSSSSSRSSSSSSSSSSPDASHTSQAPWPAEAELKWVAPRGGRRAKLHGRVDLVSYPGTGTHACCRACDPTHELSKGFHTGDTAAAATATGLDWCKKCKDIFNCA